MQQWKINLITSHAGQFVAAANGKVSTIKMAKESNWQIELAAYASVWWLQQPQKSFEAYTTAVLDYANS
jgi:hypothetical protein